MGMGRGMRAKGRGDEDKEITKWKTKRISAAVEKKKCLLIDEVCLAICE